MYHFHQCLAVMLQCYSVLFIKITHLRSYCLQCHCIEHRIVYFIIGIYHHMNILFHYIVHSKWTDRTYANVRKKGKQNSPGRATSRSRSQPLTGGIESSWETFNVDMKKRSHFKYKYSSVIHEMIIPYALVHYKWWWCKFCCLFSDQRSDVCCFIFKK